MHLEKKIDYFNLDSNLWLLDMQAKRAQTAKKTVWHKPGSNQGPQAHKTNMLTTIPQGRSYANNNVLFKYITKEKC